MSDEIEKNINEESKHTVIPINGLYENWFLDYASYVILDRAEKGAVVPAELAPISLLLSKLNLSKNNIQYDDLSAKPTKGMDLGHLKIRDLDLIAEGLSYSPDGIKVKVKKGFMKEKSGFQLSRLQGDVSYTDKAIYVKNFILKTPHDT